MQAGFRDPYDVLGFGIGLSDGLSVPCRDGTVPRRVIAVLGAGRCDATAAAAARALGRLLAEAGAVVATGGLGGVMEAASEGARSAGGLVLGILPGPDPSAANPFVDVAVATGCGDARNAILANTAEGFVAVAGSYGTLSEIAFALQRGKPVVSLGSWGATGAGDGAGLPVRVAATPEEAARLVLAATDPSAS